MRIFVQSAKNNTEVFNFDDNSLTIKDLCKSYSIDTEQASLISNGHPIEVSDLLSLYDLSTIEVRMRLKGGKGGFGSLLKGQPAVKKRTKNFDACRDISGRRLRHVNQEKQLIEWEKKKKEEEKMIEESNKGGKGDEIKRKLHEDRRNEIVKENKKFFSEDYQTKRAVEKSISFLNKKRLRGRGKGVKTEDKEIEEKNNKEKNDHKEKKIDMKEFEIKENVSKEDLLNEILAL